MCILIGSLVQVTLSRMISFESVYRSMYPTSYNASPVAALVRSRESLRKAFHYSLHTEPHARSLTSHKSITTSCKIAFHQEFVPSKMTAAHWATALGTQKQANKA